ncbi:MAG: guanylate kinase [Methylophilaceae bacterium]|jgi:guanylate kinase|nr:guanylate kinase [Methylophilaceae bacterium]MBL6726343.1 guanylate kinase [Methylophilaceae bacterium]MBL6728363.1 guanylate kinase [Methylophilaceae bacterium]MBL6790587.1 guanylate kinase [Methylophilaceae bacterium]
MKIGRLFIITAASGAGKTSLVKALVKQNKNLFVSVSFTTRQPRQSEENGKDYWFVSQEKFNEMQLNDKFLETAECHGAHYGTSKEVLAKNLEEGHDVILEIDWQGAFSVKKIFSNAISIFILPPSMDVLTQRLKNRNEDSDDVIKKRLAAARGEMAHLEKFDYVTINDDFETTLKELEAIIKAENLKTSIQFARYKSVIEKLRN